MAGQGSSILCPPATPEQRCCFPRHNSLKPSSQHAQVATLRRAKATAVGAEDYDEAKRLKSAIDRFATGLIHCV